ncbi:MAG: hypothetical protein FWD17_16950 [Polyangiaceae bacterium]|nr:hypothetical protein [Polyangiaceae bacterium]
MKWAFLALGLGLATASTEARAQDADHGKAARAFTAARAAIDAGDCRAAILKLRESLAYEPSVGAHLSMADCFEPIDALAAWNELKAAEELAISRNDERSAVAHSRAAALEPKLAGLRLTFATEGASPETAAVRIDGDVVRDFVVRGGFVAATPGGHTVEVVARGKRPWKARVMLTTGATATVGAVLEDEPIETPPGVPAPVGEPPRPPVSAGVPPAPPGPPIEAPATPRGTEQRVAGLATGALGLASLGIGGAFGIAALIKNADVRHDCGGDVQRCTGDPRIVEGARHAAQTDATMSTAGLIAGGVLTAAGIIVTLTAPAGDKPQVGVRVSPVGLELAGDF